MFRSKNLELPSLICNLLLVIGSAVGDLKTKCYIDRYTIITPVYYTYRMLWMGVRCMLGVCDTMVSF